MTNPAPSFFIYLKQNTATFGLTEFTYVQDQRAPTRLVFDPSDEGNDSSQIIVTGLIVGETYNIYPEDPDPLTGCDSGSKQEVEADATSMSFSLDNF